MSKRFIIGITFLIVVILILGLYFIFGVSNDPELKLTSDKIINDPQITDSIINKMISPNGNNLTKTVLDADDPNVMDESWKFAYYVCNENEHSGWIYDYAGGDKAKPTLYGPYSWCFQ